MVPGEIDHFQNIILENMGQLFDRFKKYVKSEIKFEDDIRKAEKTINSEEDELRHIIEELNNVKEKRESTDTSDHSDKMTAGRAYSILDIKDNASITEIKSAYKVKLKEYHPDRVAHLGEELRNLAAIKTLEINSAYEFLRQLKEV